VRLLLEILYIRVSHFCACVWSFMAVDWAWCGRDLYVRVSGGFSLNDTS
jgi:hypothetical protein